MPRRLCMSYRKSSTGLSLILEGKTFYEYVFLQCVTYKKIIGMRILQKHYILPYKRLLRTTKTWLWFARRVISLMLLNSGYWFLVCSYSEKFSVYERRIIEGSNIKSPTGSRVLHVWKNFLLKNIKRHNGSIYTSLVMYIRWVCPTIYFKALLTFCLQGYSNFKRRKQLWPIIILSMIV